jgi:N-acylneuraminate cytidylyltransferase
MSTKPRVVAMIPARGGSVGIPMKNIKPLLGRPLLDWSVRAALDSGVFAEVWVSTDNKEIAAEAEKSGAKVHWRAAETATSSASTESALADFVGKHPDYDILCLIQATSPLVVPNDFTKALAELEKQQADSLVSVVRAHRFLWKKDPKTGEAVPLNYDPLKRPRRQDWNGELIENGAFYLTRKALWDKVQCRLGGKMALFEMEEHTLAELDSEVDWEIITGLCTKYGYFGADGRPAEKKQRV